MDTYEKHINALLGFVCYTIGVIAAAYYGLWKMLVLPLHTLAVSFLAGDLNVTLLAVCVVKYFFNNDGRIDLVHWLYSL